MLNLSIFSARRSQYFISHTCERLKDSLVSQKANSILSRNGSLGCLWFYKDHWSFLLTHFSLSAPNNPSIFKILICIQGAATP